MRGHHPRSTPFPYTTLFRSGQRVDRRCDVFSFAVVLCEMLTGKAPFVHDNRIDTMQDRKSTRLNSSHSQISYAVFCLKKKTSLEASCLGSKSDDALIERHFH